MELVRPRKTKLSIDMAPMIDVVFQLLIFFMLTSVFAQPSLRLDLPKASIIDQQKQERVVISLTADGHIHLGDKVVPMERLKQEITLGLEKAETKAVDIKADKNMPYKYFVEVMDLSRQAGAKQVNIVHEK